MTSAPHLSTTPLAGPANELPRHPLRFRLRPEAPTSGHVNGAWWPRSRELTAELPALLAVLAAQLGDVPRVRYNLTEWNTAPHRIAANGVWVRLDGFWSRPADTVDLITVDRRCVTLLVVPSNTDEFAAQQIMMHAVDGVLST